MAQSNGAANGGAPQYGFITEYRNSPFSIFYGISGTGKTVAAIRTMPNAYFVGPKNGVAAVAVGAVGWMPRFVDESLKTIEQVNAFATGQLKGSYGLSLPELVEKKLVDGLVVDDESIMAGRTEAIARAGHSNNGGVSYAAYADIMVVMQCQRDFLRDLGCSVIINCHEKAPWIYEGVRILGGPELPGKVAPIHFPPITDNVIRFVRDFMLPQEAHGWNVRLAVDPYDADWYTKDKYHVIGRRGPLNVREHWTAAGLRLSRPPGLEWQDEIAEEVAQAVAAGHNIDQVWAYVCQQKVEPRLGQMQIPLRPGKNIIEWTRGDAYARVEIRRQQAERFAAMTGRVAR